MAGPAVASRDELRELRAPVPKHCGWCGRRLEQSGTVGRRRRYCGQSCRQRAYERRAAVQRTGLPEDAVVLSDTEIATLQDRLFQLRCAAEDVVTAAEDGASTDEIRRMAAELASAAHELEQLR
ncbi:hypothetical protein DI005_15145 [Prauserella sp. PE36]|uniref:Recombinase zinc beta ribbon domain-containing protein n=1 Tax=Prauserella endophytica TaxID=1592324 RepID=A0ABY2SA97_9PSEU|nr:MULTISPECIES: hypothetical protein [Prauserella]PXY29491.1 hypothetical protein BAY59_17125 [Prauserella coralliicola]RBM19594.1 hypothetical protein DI005_15145 [Prauserella sp. PE36]TKG72431.1 hypothetical protein FCN18_08885 [Prauserella endophytica]